MRHMNMCHSCAGAEGDSRELPGAHEMAHLKMTGVLRMLKCEKHDYVLAVF